MSLTFRTPSFLHPLTNLKHPQNPQSKPFFFTLNQNHQPHKILCINKPNKPNNPDLTSEFASQLREFKSQLQDKDNAMKKSKQLLFSDFCNYLNLNSDDVKNKWRNLSEDEKLGLIKGFVSDWGLNFHPLSPKSVKALVEEFVVIDSEEIQSSNLFQKHGDYDYDGDDDSVEFFPSLKKLFMGLSSDSY